MVEVCGGQFEQTDEKRGRAYLTQKAEYEQLAKIIAAAYAPINDAVEAVGGEEGVTRRRKENKDWLYGRGFELPFPDEPQIMRTADAIETGLMPALMQTQIAFDMMVNSLDNMSRSLAQAIVYGQDFGEAMVSSLKAMVAQLIAAIAKALILATIMQFIPTSWVSSGARAVGFGTNFFTLLTGEKLNVLSSRSSNKNSRSIGAGAGPG